MHHVDVQSVVSAERGHAVDEAVERNRQIPDVDDHDHGEVLVQHGLGDVENVRAALRAPGADFGDNTDGIPSDDGDDCFHGELPFR